jgi:hypothetical protein
MGWRLVYGAIWTIFCLPIVEGINPVSVFLEELGPIGAATVPLLFLFWTLAFFGFFTLWSRRHPQ